MGEHIIRYGNKCVFLAKPLAVFANESKSVHVRINHKAHVCFALFEEVANLGEVLRQRFRIVREMTVRRAVEFDDILYTQSLENGRNSQSAY